MARFLYDNPKTGATVEHVCPCGEAPKELVLEDGTVCERNLGAEIAGRGPDTPSCWPMKSRALAVHPTQVYASAMAAVCCVILYGAWRRSQKAEQAGRRGFLINPGSVFSLMFILYGVTRFFIEFLRDDNPFEHGWWALYKGGTISQNLSIYMFILGIILMLIFRKMRPYNTSPRQSTQGQCK